MIPRQQTNQVASYFTTKTNTIPYEFIKSVSAIEKNGPHNGMDAFSPGAAIEVTDCIVNIIWLLFQGHFVQVNTSAATKMRD